MAILPAARGLALGAGSAALILGPGMGRGPAFAAPKAAQKAGPAECRPGAAFADGVAALGPRGEIRLVSGARVLLDSIRWPEDDAAAQAARSWLEARRGRPLSLTPKGEPDRWGRRRVEARDLSDDASPDLAGGLVAAGLALVDPGEGDTLCRPALLALEQEPRDAGAGIWGAAPVSATDGEALRARAGRFAVVTGRIRHVGERTARTYLDFVRKGEDGLTATVSKRTWRRLAERGLTAAALDGRVVRLRGLVEIRRGPMLDVVAAETLELLPAPQEAPAPERQMATGGDERGERAPRR